MDQKPYFGFTLSELLVALGVLALITIFTIPKILGAQQDSRKKAIFRETISAIATAQHLAIINREFDKTTVISTALLPRLNAVKICNADAAAELCWPQGWAGPFSEDQNAGAILHNGATVAGMNKVANAAGTDAIIIDWNGAAAPNVEGDDQLYMSLCYDSTGTGYSVYCTRSPQQDYIDYMQGGDQAAHRALWNWIFE